MSGTKLYTIVGAGAIGGIVGAHLLEAGHRVRFIERDTAHVAAIRDDGLRLEGTRTLTVEPEEVALPEEAEGPFERVLLAVKSRHTHDALQVLAPRLANDGLIVSLQNGLEEYKIAEAVGVERTVGAFLTFGGHYREPGTVVYGGSGSFVLGELDGVLTPRLKELQSDLSALQPVQATDNIFGFLWSKMALGAAYFGTALVDADVPEIYRHDGPRKTLGRLAGEVARVAHAVGVATESVDGFDPSVFSPEQPDEGLTMAAWAAQTTYWTGHEQRRTGIWRDLAVHHRKTEVDELLGPIVRFASEKKLPVPYLRTLIAFVHEAEEGRRPLAWSNLDELADRAAVPRSAT